MWGVSGNPNIAPNPSITQSWPLCILVPWSCHGIVSSGPSGLAKPDLVLIGSVGFVRLVLVLHVSEGFELARAHVGSELTKAHTSWTEFGG